MKEKLRKYVEDMVRDIPKTRNVVDLKEEIIGNMEERYDDLRLYRDLSVQGHKS